MPSLSITVSLIHSHIWLILVQMLFPIFWCDVVCLVLYINPVCLKSMIHIVQAEIGVLD
ncbi:unnamed protein product [Schistosoma margrebowiei]|uniref:Uncharacterized protein n=1 Tax=Schistosoma margrebowiei TaxID=48269 RepID=A0A183LEC2_9TREM|nr:unnamed protein product [Schistosoma margrebowiei]